MGDPCAVTMSQYTNVSLRFARISYVLAMWAPRLLFRCRRALRLSDEFCSVTVFVVILVA